MLHLVLRGSELNSASNFLMVLHVLQTIFSGYLTVFIIFLIIICSGMVNSFSYVGWVDDQGVGHIEAYWMDGKSASSIHPTGEELSDKKCETRNGIVTFEFSRPLQPSCSKGTLCKNVIDPATPLKVVWALGDAWTSGMFITHYCEVCFFNSYPCSSACFKDKLE